MTQDLVTVIRFAPDHTALVAPAAAEVVVPVGAAALAQRLFRHDPPTAGEIEQAIDTVEDGLAATGHAQAERGDLQLGEPRLLDLLGLRHAGARASREQVEQQFQQLAATALGRPPEPALRALGVEGAAQLLILRECLHHLGYGGVRRAAG